MKISRFFLLTLLSLLAIPGALSAQSDPGAAPAPASKSEAPPVKPVTVSFAVVAYADGFASYQSPTGPVTLQLNSRSFDYNYPYVGPPDLLISSGREFNPATATHVALSTDPRVKNTVLVFAPGPHGAFQVVAVPIDFSPGKVKIVNMCPQGAAFKWGTNAQVELKQNEMKIYTPPATGNGTASSLVLSDFGDWSPQGNIGANLNPNARNFVLLMNGDYFPALSRRLVQMFILNDTKAPPATPAAARGPRAGAQ